MPPTEAATRRKECLLILQKERERWFSGRLIYRIKVFVCHMSYVIYSETYYDRIVNKKNCVKGLLIVVVLNPREFFFSFVEITFL